EHERGGVRGGKAVAQPVQATVGDRRHIDQHLRQHHEQDREDEELAREPEARRPRGAGLRRWGFVVHSRLGHASQPRLVPASALRDTSRPTSGTNLASKGALASIWLRAAFRFGVPTRAYSERGRNLKSAALVSRSDAETE